MKERKKKFKQAIWKAIGMNFNEFSKEMILDFFDYWTEANENGRKMRFEKEKTFSIIRRLRTWKKNAEKWNKTNGTQGFNLSFNDVL